MTDESEKGLFREALVIDCVFVCLFLFCVLYDCTLLSCYTVSVNEVSKVKQPFHGTNLGRQLVSA